MLGGRQSQSRCARFVRDPCLSRLSKSGGLLHPVKDRLGPHLSDDDSRVVTCTGEATPASDVDLFIYQYIYTRTHTRSAWTKRQLCFVDSYFSCFYLILDG